MGYREALTRNLDDGHAPIDNNWPESQIRPWATGRSQARCARVQRTATIISLIRSAKLSSLDSYAYLKDVPRRLPTHRTDDIESLHLHRGLTSGTSRASVLQFNRPLISGPQCAVMGGCGRPLTAIFVSAHKVAARPEPGLNARTKRYRAW